MPGPDSSGARAAAAGVTLNDASTPWPTTSSTRVIPLAEVTNGAFYLEIHYSTGTHQIVFVAGPSERGSTVRHRVPGAYGKFSAPAVEVASIYQPASALPIGALQASFSQVGVSQLLNPRNPSSPAKRLTLNAESLNTVEATVSGQAPTAGNPLTLVPSRLGAGSAFTVTAVD